MIIFGVFPKSLRDENPLVVENFSMKKKDHEIRDPIFECITFTKEERALIDSPLSQRLKHVQQLSMVTHAYNGGVHSRFTHCLGVMKLSGDYMEHLLDNEEEWDKWWEEHRKFMDRKHKRYCIQLARIAGFLHDIGHGPFSHSFDRVVYKKIYGVEDGGHDIARVSLVQHELLKPYIEACGVKIEDLLEIWKPKPTGIFAIIKNIVEGPLGSDRMDFTQRDAYYTGMQHLGTIPTQRLIKNSRLIFVNGELRLCYNSKCMSDIIRTLDGRLNLYDSVYLHKKSVEASLLVELMLEKLCASANPFVNLVALTQDPEKFQWLNDHKIYAMILASNNPEAIKLYERLILRNLPKTEHEIRISDFSKPFDIKEYEQKWYPNGGGVVVKTRPISGIDYRKFHEYNIFFYEKGSAYVSSCEKILKEIGYTAPFQPYYIVRGIRLGTEK